MTEHTFTTMRVTPDLAAQWLTKNNYNGQRTLRRHHVRWLASLMQNGHFRHGSVVSFGVVGTKHYLVNGYHTLSALAWYHTTPITLTVEDIPCATEDEVARLYATFDRNLPRSHSDILHAHGFAEHYNLRKAQVNALAATMPYVLSGLNDAGFTTETPIGLLCRDGEMRYLHMRTWANETRHFWETCIPISNVIEKYLLRAAVQAVALVTFRHAPERAAQFWEFVAHDDGLKQGTPCKTLLNWLARTPVQLNRGPVYTRYVLSAWNAWYEERATLRMLFPRDMRLAPFVAGTPLDGKHRYTYVGTNGEPLAMPARVQEDSC